MGYDIGTGQMGEAESRGTLQLIRAEDLFQLGDQGFRCLGRHGPNVDLAGIDSGRAGWHIGIESRHQIYSHAIGRLARRLVAVIYTKSVTARTSTALLEYRLFTGCSAPVIFLLIATADKLTGGSGYRFGRYLGDTPKLPKQRKFSPKVMFLGKIVSDRLTTRFSNTVCAYLIPKELLKEQTTRTGRDGLRVTRMIESFRSASRLRHWRQSRWCSYDSGRVLTLQGDPKLRTWFPVMAIFPPRRPGFKM